METLTDADAKYFWTKVNKTENCWEWTASLGTGGYGQHWVRKCVVAAHRISYELHFGPIPEGACVLHACDNRRCVRPEHLFLGTKRDNSRDMVAKGRSTKGRPLLRGEDHPQVKLTAEQVQEIRRRYAAGGVTITELGDEVGVTAAHVSLILHRRLWGHLPLLEGEAAIAPRLANGNRSMTREQAEEIRRRYAAGGTSTYKLAAEFQTSQRTVFDIVKGKIYT